jgi:WD40 repeat protein
MRWQFHTAAAGVTASLGAILGGLIYAQSPAKNATPEPIVLSYHETPIFKGPHEHWVEAIAFSPDGKTLATGCGDCFLRLWDAATGRLLSIQGQDAMRGIKDLAFSPDGRTVAGVGGGFGVDVLLWDTTSGRIVQEIPSPTPSPGATARPGEPGMVYKGKPIVFKPLNAVAYSPDGKILAAAADNVVFRDAQSGSLITTLGQPAKGAMALAFSPDGKTMATAATDKRVRLWSVPSGELQATLDGPTQPLAAVKFSPDGKRVVATGSGKRSILSRDETPAGYLWSWELPDGRAKKVELGNVNVRQVVFTSPTSVAVAAGAEVLGVDLQSGQAASPRKIRAHSQDVLSLAISPDGRRLASGARDRTVDVIDLESGELVYRLPGLSDIYSYVASSADGKQFATATIDVRFSNRLPNNDAAFPARYQKFFSDPANVGRINPSVVRVWAPRDGHMQALLPLPPSQVTAIKYLPEGHQLAVAGWLPDKGGMLSIWDADSGKHLRDLPAGSSEVLSIALSPDGGTLASADAGGNVDLWNLQSAAKTRSHKHDHPVEAVAFSRDGKLLATGDNDATVRLFDAASGAELRTLKCKSRLEALDFSPDSKLLAVGTRFPGLELWDLGDKTDGVTLKASGDYFETMPGFVSFSPDGRYVVCGGHGKDIAVFDVASRTLHKELRGHGHPATAIAFLPDGRLVSGGEERTIRLWDPTLGTGLATWIAWPAHEQQGWSDQWIGFTKSGQFIGSAKLDRLVGWITAGDLIPAAEDAGRRRRVESLFDAGAAVQK